MAETFNGSVKVIVDGTLSSSVDVGSGIYGIPLSSTTNFSNGTAINQANQSFTDTRTLAASASEDLDLSGGLTNIFGTSLVFTKIKAIVITAAAANTNNVVVGGAAATQMANIFGDVTDKINIRPGGTFALVAPDATAYGVTAGTADLLKIANSSGTTEVTYTIVIIGVV